LSQRNLRKNVKRRKFLSKEVEGYKSMDFFAQQDKSKGKTVQLVFLFILAIAGIILSVYTVITFAFYYLQNSQKAGYAASDFQWLNPNLFFTVSVFTLAVILIGSIFKMIELGKGGSGVAESLGGSLINHSTTDPLEKRLLNVVQEMAIASGISVPQVYLLSAENGINAFAAGYSPNNAVVAVTSGCLKRLNRDELQGVVAHEFSHILNGDMRLNIRLIGLLSGILIISNIGYLVLRSTSGSRKKGAQLAIAGIGLLVIGYIGMLVGRLIQSSISRQREYLADASAVQFTRNPMGIGNALKKIGGFSVGSAITSPAAGEACHMFFVNAISSLFATHPPLVDRIQRIDPSFKGEFKELSAADEQSISAGAQGFAALNAEQQIHADGQSVINRVGNITQENVTFSAELLSAVPTIVREELHDILGASAVVCALLLDKDPDGKKKQIDLLGGKAPSEMIRHIMILDRYLADLNPRLRLPLLDMAIPALRLMSHDQYENLIKTIDILVEADKKISFFEFSVKEVITRRLHAAFLTSERKVVYKSITPLIPDIIQLISALARVGSASEAEVEQAFKAAASNLPVQKDKLKPVEPIEISLQSLHEALDHFASASPGVKKVIFDACAQCVFFDKTVSIHEAELLRAVAYSMDIPLPPFLSK